jgi:uncharacterized membrane protein
VRRIASLDIVRGAVMVLMAIDHVRVYAGHPPGGPTAGIFFTRWVTNFAAPAFCFFAGTSAFFHGRKLGNRRALSRYLIERGAILILLELTLIREAWAFNVDYAHFIQGNVIWMLGWCMILMAGLIRFSPKALGISGLAIVFGQQLLGWLPSVMSDSMRDATKVLWQFLYTAGKVELGSGGPPFVIIYSIVPWIGVMMAGYAFGLILLRPDAERRKLCLQIGLASTAAFIVVAGAQVLLRTPTPGELHPIFQFLGQRKYPASQLFLLMTLGPTIALMPLAETAQGAVARVLATFGHVPMFYYLMHIPLIHSLAIIVSLIRTGSVTPWLFGNHPWAAPPLPPGYQWSLGLLYVVFAIAVFLLYFPCRWYGDYKARHRDSWLRFI